MDLPRISAVSGRVYSCFNGVASDDFTSVILSYAIPSTSTHFLDKDLPKCDNRKAWVTSFRDTFLLDAGGLEY